MSGWTVRRLDGWSLRLTTLFGSAVLLTAYPSSRLPGQVGYDPGASPFRDLRRGLGPMLRVGYLTGERGEVGIGHSNGLTYGLRFEASLGGPTVFSAGVAYALTDRYVVDPLQGAATRKSGPYADDMLLTDVGLQFLLTGAKSWHGLSPYVGAALGLAISRGQPGADSSGYRFGTKFTVAPGAGVRWYPSQRFTVSADLRAVFWKLRYPASFKVPSPVDSTRVLPVNARSSDWTTHPWLSIGVGWIF